MKILYDHQMFSLQKYGGITRYFCELMKNMPPEHQFSLSVLFSDNYYLKENYGLFKKRNILPNAHFKGKRFIKEKLYTINNRYSAYCISSNKYDLLHPTYYNDYFLSIVKTPYVITVHDLIYFKFKDSFYKNNPDRPQMEKVIRKANRIIAVSENTKRDILEYFNIDAGKIDVVHHGYNLPGTELPVNTIGRYLLFVGERGYYKNFKTFAEAATPLLKEQHDLKLVCVGKPFTKDEQSHVSRLGIADQSMTITADNKKLDELYGHALVFVNPSLYEGFGMSILEAFANGCPVCLSNASCFPEIAGNAGVYFDPNDISSILEAIRKVIGNEGFRNEMITAGNERLAAFSWEKAARETAAAYEKAV